MAYLSKQWQRNQSRSLKKRQHPDPRAETSLHTVCIERFFQCRQVWLILSKLSLRTVHFKGQRCSAGKHNKIRLTGLAAGNAFGERLPIFFCKVGEIKVLQKSKTFTLSIPVHWMSSELFEKWVREPDRKSVSDKGKSHSSSTTAKLTHMSNNWNRLS